MIKLSEILLSESINDSGIFKSVFLAGQPGAGKTYTMSKITSGRVSPRVVSTDKFVEHLSKQSGLDLTKQVGLKGYAELDKSKKLTSTQLVQYINSMLPLYIDGTSSSRTTLFNRIACLETYGYDTAMVWVNCSLETSIERVKRRSRVVPIEVIKNAYQSIQNNKEYLQSKFSTFVEIDNDSGVLDNQAIVKAFNALSGYFSSPVKNGIGKENIMSLESQRKQYLSEIVSRRGSVKYPLNDITSNINSTWYSK